jgi:small subunit ribosomal protein S17
MTDKKVKKVSPVKVAREKQDIKSAPKKAVIHKKFEGVVVSDKMDKTIVALVTSVKIAPKYEKRYTATKRYKVHDEKNQYKEGDKVTFIECRPISKDKKWRVIYN